MAQPLTRVFKSDVKGFTASSSSTQNVAFVSENTSSTNDVSTTYDVSNSSSHNSQYEHPSSYSLLANQSSCPQLDHEDLKQLDEFDLEEMNLEKQVESCNLMPRNRLVLTKLKLSAIIVTRQGIFSRECRSKGNQDSRRRDAWNTRNKDKDNGRRSGKQEESKALVTLDGEGVDWTSHSEDEQENYALMAYNSSGSDTEVTSCSKECKESYAKLKKLYDEQREQLGDASIEIQAYTQALKKVEAQLVAHQQSQLWYEEKIRFMKIDLDDKTDVLTYHKKLLAEAEKEKEELKAKVEKWHNSSKNLNILLNSQMSARDKAGLGYGDQMNKGVLSYENEVFQSVFVSRTSDIEDSPVNDRYAEGMHAVPPPMTGIYIPSGPDKEIDDSQFTYGPKQSKPSESDARSSDFNSCESNSSEETHESMPEPVVNEPKVVSQPKVWSDAPIIEEYESDSDDEHVSVPSKEQETPSFAFINTVKHVKTPRQTVKEQNTCSKSPKPDKKDCSGLMSKKLGLGYGFTKKACFVCGSFSHLIRDCDFHEKRMAKQAELNKRMTVLTRTGRIQVNTARTSDQKVNTAEVKAVSVVGGKRETAFIPSARCKLETANRLYWKKWDVTTHMTKKQGLLAELTNLMVAPVALEMCDKKNKVLFTNTECLVLSPEFKLPDENQVLLRVPRHKTNIAQKERMKDELERLERQEKDVNDAAEALRKEFAQDIEDLLL
ncbi:hypothetical protein Tco_0876000 [Tanacetum coccineum]|uniref:CCHC-type domain-containing protein n=1 Tax=Tanacetum coccineum TaxID=301880 RepID=A0ABQ5BW16_9ASTR